MEQKKKKPVARTEQSVRASQKRKEIRRESARLQRLRERQKRKAKRRVIKRIDKGVFKHLIIAGGILCAVVLSMIIFFRVEHVEVRGAVYYTADEIRNACSVERGDNLLTLSRGRIAGNIIKPLKYVESVRVVRRLPDTLIIYITESDPKYAIRDTAGNYFLVTAQGKVTEEISQRVAEEYIRIDDVRIVTPAELGEEMVLDNTGGASQARLDALKTLLVQIEAAELEEQIVSVSVPSAGQLSLQYEDRFEVKLGTADRMAYKLEYLKAVVAEEESYVTGKIDLTMEDGDKVFLHRDE
ncbi:MAG: FtsQ-type POTRA domain-containing protein [Oscillospiraceae bacterium]|nr:FtsQ-type POTRA domain-containing protein [Oscillospiraceae bacterium]